MPLNFPENPELNQIYPYNNIRWKWNGYAWDSAGICGSLNAGGGICGDYVSSLDGGVGITLTAPSGVVEISLKLDEPNIGPTNTELFHAAPTTFSADSGYARKVAFLESDGSIQFDYIKNYDVFRTAEFNFDIASFTIPNLSPQPARAVGAILPLSGYFGSISYIQNPVIAQVTIPNATPTQQFGFPISASGVGLNDVIFGNQYVTHKTLSYNNIGTNSDSYIFRLGATGENSNGTQVYKTKDFTLYFYNYIFWGVFQSLSITPSSFSSLNSVLQGTRNYTIQTTIPQDDANPYYLYFAYPSRLGNATFRDNSTNLEGGFVQIGGPQSYTNCESPCNGYTENYTIYRSERGNLGQVSITVL
jgi:hypothetical protein